MKKGRKRFSEPLTCADRNGVKKVNVMGGTVIETESERLRREGINQGISQGISQGKAQLLIEMGQKEGLDDATILKRMQEWIGLSLEQTVAYLEQYGKQPV